MVFGHRFAVLDQDVPKKAISFFAIGEGFTAAQRITFLDFLPSDFGFAKPWAVCLVQASLKYPELYRAGKEKMYMILGSDHVLDIVGRVAWSKRTVVAMKSQTKRRGWVK